MATRCSLHSNKYKSKITITFHFLSHFRMFSFSLYNSCQRSFFSGSSLDANPEKKIEIEGNQRGILVEVRNDTVCVNVIVIRSDQLQLRILLAYSIFRSSGNAGESHGLFSSDNTNLFCGFGSAKNSKPIQKFVETIHIHTRKYLYQSLIFDQYFPHIILFYGINQ